MKTGHVANLGGQQLTLALDFDTLERLSRVPVSADGKEAFCPFKVARGEQNPGVATILRVMAVAAGTTPEKVAALRAGPNLTVEFARYCFAVVVAYAPEKVEEPKPPKE